MQEKYLNRTKVSLIDATFGAFDIINNKGKVVITHSFKTTNILLKERTS
jgi:hypothetical protein